MTLPDHKVQGSDNDGSAGNHSGVRYLQLGISSGKKGRFQLMKQLSAADQFLFEALKANRRVLICCENGHDLSVVVAISVLAKYFTEDGQFGESERPQAEITKQLIRKRLHFIMKYRHMASPLRSLMRVLNSHLMSGEVGKGEEADDNEDEDEDEEGRKHS
jgi:hypothetical protein